MAWLKRLSGLIICVCAVFLMSHNALAEGPEAPSDIVSSDNNGSLYMDYEICSRVLYNSRYVANCNGVNSVPLTLYDDPLNSDTGEYTLFWRYEIDSSNIGNDKFVLIRRLTYLPYISVSSGDNIFFRLTSAHYNIFLGTAREFFMYSDYGNRYSYNMGGVNSYIWSSRWNDMFSCPDQTSDVCQLKYSWNTITGLGSNFRIANAFTLPSGWQRFGGIDILNNMYDNNTESYEWTPYITNSVLYYIDTANDLRYMNGVAYITFETNFDITTNYFNLSETSSGVNVNDVLEGMMDDVENISSQTPSDMNVGSSATATNLISYITNFISYIGNISPANDCNIVLDFPNYAGGSMTFNLCQFKDNFGSIISVFSSLVLIVFYIPLAYKMLSVIYSEIRSFTNG